jgi:N6-L-threonylcarbamoyladenine synthase
MTILGIETTCDETGLAVLEFKGEKINILVHELRSQFEVHQKYGGVVPILAAREHTKNLPILYKKIKAIFDFENLDYLAFAYGPGLPPALVAGKEFAFKIAKELDKKIIPVNHLIAHLYSVLIPRNRIGFWQTLKTIKFPAIGLIISGGHTELLLMNSFTNIKKLGETLDDALGESLDKAGRLLELPYPGGPNIEKLAKKGRALFSLPRPMSFQKNYNFSFSGLKTAFWELIGEVKSLNKFDEKTKADLAASYQKASFEALLLKLKRAEENFKPKTIIVTGGVIANQTLRQWLIKLFGKSRLVFPDKSLATDNGIKIALAGYYLFQAGTKALQPSEIDINPSLDI